MLAEDLPSEAQALWADWVRDFEAFRTCIQTAARLTMRMQSGRTQVAAQPLGLLAIGSQCMDHLREMMTLQGAAADVIFPVPKADICRTIFHYSALLGACDQVAQGIGLLEKLALFDTSTVQVYLLLCWLLITQGSLIAAISVLQQTIARDSSVVDAHVLLAIAYIRLGNAEAALECLEKFSMQYPEVLFHSDAEPMPRPFILWHIVKGETLKELAATQEAKGAESLEEFEIALKGDRDSAHRFVGQGLGVNSHSTQLLLQRYSNIWNLQYDSKTSLIDLQEYSLSNPLADFAFIFGNENLATEASWVYVQTQPTPAADSGPDVEEITDQNLVPIDALQNSYTEADAAAETLQAIQTITQERRLSPKRTGYYRSHSHVSTLSRCSKFTEERSEARSGRSNKSDRRKVLHLREVRERRGQFGGESTDLGREPAPNMLQKVKRVASLRERRQNREQKMTDGVTQPKSQSKRQSSPKIRKSASSKATNDVPWRDWHWPTDVSDQHATPDESPEERLSCGPLPVRAASQPGVHFDNTPVEIPDRARSCHAPVSSPNWRLSNKSPRSRNGAQKYTTPRTAVIRKQLPRVPLELLSRKAYSAPSLHETHKVQETLDDQETARDSKCQEIPTNHITLEENPPVSDDDSWLRSLPECLSEGFEFEELINPERQEFSPCFHRPRVQESFENVAAQSVPDTCPGPRGKLPSVLDASLIQYGFPWWPCDDAENEFVQEPPQNEVRFLEQHMRLNPAMQPLRERTRLAEPCTPARPSRELDFDALIATYQGDWTCILEAIHVHAQQQAAHRSRHSSRASLSIVDLVVPWVCHPSKPSSRSAFVARRREMVQKGSDCAREPWLGTYVAGGGYWYSSPRKGGQGSPTKAQCAADGVWLEQLLTLQRSLQQLHGSDSFPTPNSKPEVETEREVQDMQPVTPCTPALALRGANAIMVVGTKQGALVDSS